jgi:hypothetical protein
MHAIQLLVLYFVVAYLATFLVAVYFAGRAARKWPTIKATLLDVATGDKSKLASNIYSPAPPGQFDFVERIAYSYLWKGRTHVGSMCYVLQLKPFAGHPTKVFLKEIREAAKNHSLTAFVDPQRPSRAVLKAEPPSEIFIFGAAALALGFAVILLFHLVHPVSAETNHQLLKGGGIAGSLAAALTIGFIRWTELRACKNVRF